MNCPVCDGVRMREVDKDGVMIDICPQCKGIWLDRGELDKLMSGVREIRDEFDAWHNERHGNGDDYRPIHQPPQAQNLGGQQPYGTPPSAYGNPPQQPAPSYGNPQHGYPPQHGHQPYGQRPYDGEYYDPYYGKRKKKKHILDRLSDIFD